MEGRCALHAQAQMLYESSCTLCNPVQERKKSSLQEEESKSRDGIYIGETSRSLNERTTEHFWDANTFSKKSNIRIAYPGKLEKHCTYSTQKISF